MFWACLIIGSDRGSHVLYIYRPIGMEKIGWAEILSTYIETSIYLSVVVQFQTYRNIYSRDFAHRLNCLWKKTRLHNKKCGRTTYFEIFLDMKHNNLCSSKELDISDYHFDTCWVWSISSKDFIAMLQTLLNNNQLFNKVQN